MAYLWQAWAKRSCHVNEPDSRAQTSMVSLRRTQRKRTDQPNPVRHSRPGARQSGEDRRRGAGRRREGRRDAPTHQQAHKTTKQRRGHSEPRQEVDGLSERATQCTQSSTAMKMSQRAYVQGETIVRGRIGPTRAVQYHASKQNRRGTTGDVSAGLAGRRGRESQSRKTKREAGYDVPSAF